MKVLLDECVPRRLAELIAGHDVQTVPGLGWASIKNGELLARAAERFELFVTVDKRMASQQSLANVKLPIIILVGASTQYKHLKHLIPDLLRMMDGPLAAQFYRLGE